MIVSAFHYRITVDRLQQPSGEGGLESLSFFARHDTDIFAAAGELRERLHLTACDATRLAVALSLLDQA